MSEQVPFWWVVVALFVPPVLSFLGVVVAQAWQDRREHRQWLREHQAKAVEDTLAHAWTLSRADVPDFSPMRFNLARLSGYGLHRVAFTYVDLLETIVAERSGEKRGMTKETLYDDLIRVANRALGVKAIKPGDPSYGGKPATD